MKFLKNIKAINTPFGGVTWSIPEENREALLSRAKSFESGRIFMGTFLQLSINNDYEFEPYIERISYYLEAIGIENIDFGLFNKDIEYEEMKVLHNKIDSQLWGKYGEIAPYFDAGINLFMTLSNNDIREFSNIVSTLELPTSLKKERETTTKWLEDLRIYFESIIFPTESKTKNG